MKCDLCNSEYTITKDNAYWLKHNAANMHLCDDCIEYYLNHRIVYNFTCRCCGAEFVMTGMMFKKRNFNPSLISICKTCMRKEATERQCQRNLKLYGNRCILHAPHVEEKTKQTNIERYGCENAASNHDIIQKINKTFNEHYGMHPLSTKEVQEKRAATNIERYGCENAASNPEIKKRIIDTFRRNYGFDNCAQAESVKEKIRSTFVMHYGMHPLSCIEIRKKIAATRAAWSDEKKQQIKERIRKSRANWTPEQKNEMRKKIAATRAAWSDEKKQQIKERMRASLQKRYGISTDNPSGIPEIRQRMMRSAKSSKIELAVVEMLLNNDIKFEHQYTLRNNDTIHTFDFAIFDNDKLIVLVDVDGLFFHAYLGDSDGKHQREDYDFKRTLCVDKGIKFIVLFEHHIDDGIKELLECINFDYDSYISYIFDWCRSIDFPYPHYSETLLRKTYNTLCKYDNFVKRNRIGDKLIRHFHPSIYHANREGFISPYDAWKNDELLLKTIKNRFIYINRIDPSRVLEGFNIAKIAPKVSYFSASLAKVLIQKYTTGHTIFDPFSGFSGRMLGVCASGRSYIGQDIHPVHIQESQNLANFLGLDAKLKVADAITSHGEYDVLFTCPPYNSKEIWGNETEFHSCDEWIDICLSNFKCKEYLFVVDKTTKYKDCIVETLTNTSHFGKNNEYVILIKK